MINHILTSKSEERDGNCTKRTEELGEGSEGEMWIYNSLSLSSSNSICKLKRDGFSCNNSDTLLSSTSFLLNSERSFCLLFFRWRQRLSAQFNLVTVKSRWIYSEKVPPPPLLPPHLPHLQILSFNLLWTEQTRCFRWIKTRTFREVPAGIGTTFRDASGGIYCPQFLGLKLWEVTVLVA